MITWILAAAIAIGGASHKQPVKVKPESNDTKVVWVCKGNSYMVLKKGFKPEKHQGCRKTKMQVDSDKP